MVQDYHFRQGCLKDVISASGLKAAEEKLKARWPHNHTGFVLEKVRTPWLT